MSKSILPILGILVMFVVLALIFRHISSDRGGLGPPLLTECASETFTVTVHLHPTERDLQAEYAETVPDAPDAARRRGFHAIEVDSGRHHIHVASLRGQFDRDRLESWGHELAHAVCGKWHPDQ